MGGSDETRSRAKALRRKLTLPEGLLWRALKGRKLEGLHFRRQHPLGAYVLDFYCDERRLCIEVDGASHGAGDRPERDERRDAWLLACGVMTLRLRAGFVLEDIDGAVATVAAAAVEQLAADPLRLVAARRSTSPGRAGARGEELRRR